MLNINRVMLTGRLTREPETKYLPSGMAVTNISIAVNRRFQDKSGEWRDETSFIDVEVWGKAAERLAETARKGQPVYVEGRLKQESWERDGVKHSKIRVSADVVKPFDVPQRGQGGPGGDEGEGGYQPSQQSSGGGYQQKSSAPRQQQQPERSSSPSDGLHFDDGPNVSDDVPF
jgi:single-strand DNA-binding protein